MSGVMAMAILLTILFSESHEQEQEETKKFEKEIMETVPIKCQNAEFDDLNCCHIPAFFVREIAKGCGGYFEVLKNFKESNFTIFRRHLMPCESWQCILDQYHLLDENKWLIEDKYIAHLEEWVNLNQDFKQVMLKAKTHCLLDLRMEKPITGCTYKDLHKCIRYYIQSDCPTTRLAYTGKCYAQKKWFEMCRVYFW